MTTVRLLIALYPDGKRRSLAVDAHLLDETDDVLAVHEPPPEDRCFGAWVVCHVPTGMVVARASSEDNARGLALGLWERLTPEERVKFASKNASIAGYAVSAATRTWFAAEEARLRGA